VVAMVAAAVVARVAAVVALADPSRHRGCFPLRGGYRGTALTRRPFLLRATG